MGEAPDKAMIEEGGIKVEDGLNIDLSDEVCLLDIVK